MFNSGKGICLKAFDDTWFDVSHIPRKIFYVSYIIVLSEVTYPSSPILRSDEGITLASQIL